MNNSKQELRELTDHMNEEQCAFIASIIKGASNNPMGFYKCDVLEAIGEDDRNVDNAVPIDYVRKMEEIDPSFNSLHRVFDYRDARIFGRFYNPAEAMLDKLNQVFKH